MKDLPTMAITTGDAFLLDELISRRFVEACPGYVPVRFPTVMPVRLLEKKFEEEDWLVKAPGKKGLEYVLTPEGTTIFAELLENPGFPRRIIYPNLQCVRENAFFQLGLEDVGDYTMEGVARVMGTANSYLSSLGLKGGKDYVFELNDLDILRGYLRGIGLKEGDIPVVLKELDRTASAIKKGQGSGEDFARKMNAYGREAAKLQQLIGLSSFPGWLKASSQNMGQMEELQNKLSGIPYVLNPALARGLSYYEAEPP